MRALLIPALLACLVVAPACKTTAGSPPPGPVVQGLIDCSAEATRATALQLMPAVATALATGDWEAELLKLVAKWGEAATDCAVQRVTRNAEQDTKASASDRLAPVRAKNGHAWLTKRAATFASTDGGAP